MVKPKMENLDDPRHMFPVCQYRRSLNFRGCPIPVFLRVVSCLRNHLDVMNPTSGIPSKGNVRATPAPLFFQILAFIHMGIAQPITAVGVHDDFHRSGGFVGFDGGGEASFQFFFFAHDILLAVLLQAPIVGSPVSFSALCKSKENAISPNC